MIPFSLLLANPGDYSSTSSNQQEMQETVQQTADQVAQMERDVDETKKTSKMAAFKDGARRNAPKIGAMIGASLSAIWGLFKASKRPIRVTRDPVLLMAMVVLGAIAWLRSYVYNDNIILVNAIVAACFVAIIAGTSDADFLSLVRYYTLWGAGIIAAQWAIDMVAINRNNLLLDLPMFVVTQLVYFAWVAHALLFQRYVENAVTRGVKFAFSLLVLFIIITSLATLPIIAGYNLRGETISFSEGGTLMIEAAQNLRNATITGAERAQNRTDDIFRYATGSYEEDVDRNAGVQTLGLRFTEVILSHTDGNYYQGDAISAWGSMESKSLDRAIFVNTSCYVDRKLGSSRVKEGSITNPEFTIQDLDYRDVVCSFPRHTFTEVQNHMLEIVADFEFSTNSYLRRYFIRQEEIVNLRQSNVDPISFFNIPREDEQGRYTNGPIELSVMKPNLLQPIEQGTQFVIGYRIDNNRRMGWNQGKLLDIKNFVISIPAGFAIERGIDGELACSHPFESYSSEQCLADCQELGKGDRCFSDCSGQNMFRLVPEEFSKAEEHGTEFIRMPLVMTCPVVVQNVQGVLDQAQIGIRNFRANADYTFQISAERPFRILARENYVNPLALTDICGFKTQHNNTQISGNPETIASAAREIIIDPKNPPEEPTPPAENGDTDETNQAPSTLPQRSEPLISNEVLAEKAGRHIECTEIIKAIIAFRNSAATSANNLGYTGIQREQLEELGASTTEDYRETFNDITHTARYLRDKLDNDPRCTVNGQQILDCALGLFVCDSPNNQCAQAQVPIIIQLAKYYGE